MSGSNRVALIAVNLHRINYVHLAADAAGTLCLVNGVACVFFRQLVDVVARAGRLVF